MTMVVMTRVTAEVKVSRPGYEGNHRHVNKYQNQEERHTHRYPDLGGTCLRAPLTYPVVWLHIQQQRGYHRDCFLPGDGARLILSNDQLVHLQGATRVPYTDARDLDCRILRQPPSLALCSSKC